MNVAKRPGIGCGRWIGGAVVDDRNEVLHLIQLFKIWNMVQTCIQKASPARELEVPCIGYVPIDLVQQPSLSAPLKSVLATSF